MIRRCMTALLVAVVLAALQCSSATAEQVNHARVRDVMLLKIGRVQGFGDLIVKDTNDRSVCFMERVTGTDQRCTILIVMTHDREVLGFELTATDGEIRFLHEATVIFQERDEEHRTELIRLIDEAMQQEAGQTSAFAVANAYMEAERTEAGGRLRVWIHESLAYELP